MRAEETSCAGYEGTLTIPAGGLGVVLTVELPGWLDIGRRPRWFRVTRSDATPVCWEVKQRRCSLDSSGPQYIYLEGPEIKQIKGPVNTEIFVTLWTCPQPPYNCEKD